MRIGISGSGLIALNRPVTEIVDHAVEAERDGFASYWLAQLAVPDALTVLGAAGLATSTIELGTAVIATWPRHPLMLAAQALTVSDMAQGRLALGIGLAHKATIEERLRIPFARPAKHMEEYLDVLLPALRDRAVDATGEIWSGFAETTGGPANVPPPPVLIAAMGPRMLELAGGTADGNILWLSGPRTIETVIAPAMAKAAAEAGRAPGRIVAGVPVCVTDKPDEVRGLIATFLGDYNELPSYRGVMDVEGVDGPEGVSLVGDEEAVRAGIQSFADAGATDFTPVEFVLDDEARVRTRALLTSLL
ncbi:MAG TPA: TIGR03564 family F420-dependent LLM class oxidoreductase [Acidimicrobiales bacterium]|nr:TIGR03564 family F420-dependent LLM class oxidoreductase [Acidimicrobiales bacterium]